MFRLIYRQRRRILFSTFLITLALFMYLMDALSLGLLGVTEPSFPGHFFLTIALTLLVCALIAMAAFSIWLCLFPTWRSLIEQLGIMVFIYAAFEALWPDFILVPFIGDFLPIIVFFAVFMLAYGTALDRFPIALGLVSRRSMVSNDPPEALWARLVPLPDHLNSHWDSLLHKLEADSETPAKQRATYNHGASLFQFQRQHFTELNAPNRASYRFDGDVSDANKPITGGTYKIDITPEESGHTRVTLTEIHDALLPRLALQFWFDDALGDVADSLRARDRGKRDWSLTARYRRKATALS